MKRIIVAREAERALRDIFTHSMQRWGEAQADAYARTIMARLRKLANGELPRARSCEPLMHGVRSATGLTYFREGRHYLILRESAEALELVEIFHDQMDIDKHLAELTTKADP